MHYIENVEKQQSESKKMFHDKKMGVKTEKSKVVSVNDFTLAMPFEESGRNALSH